MVELLRHDDVTVVSVGPGNIDSLDEPRLSEIAEVLLDQAVQAEPPRVVLDLSETEVIGSRFIELLVRAWKRLAQRGGTMALCGLRPFCAEVVRVMRFDALWHVFADSRAVIEALCAGSAGAAT